MKKGTMMVTMGPGVITLALDDDGMVVFRLTAGLTTVEGGFTREEALSLGQALVGYGTEENHPDACCSCGSLTPTPGCQCDDRPVTWWVASRPSAGDGTEQPDLRLACENAEHACAEAERMRQEDAAKHYFGKQYFAAALSDD